MRVTSLRIPFDGAWKGLAQWSPRLFVLAALLVLLGAANSGLTLLSDGHRFDEWLGVVLELGRLAALLGTAGLTAQMATRNRRLGNIARAVASLAVIFVSALLVLATLEAVGVPTGSIGVLGLVAFVLSVGTFFVTGSGIILTGAHAPRLGALLLGNVLALLAVFFGRLVVPLGVVATVVPLFQVLLYLGVGYTLRAGEGKSQGTDQTAEPTT